MPSRTKIMRGKDTKGNFFRWGKKGQKYYYQAGNVKSRTLAKSKCFNLKGGLLNLTQPKSVYGNQDPLQYTQHLNNLGNTREGSKFNTTNLLTSIGNAAEGQIGNIIEESPIGVVKTALQQAKNAPKYTQNNSKFTSFVNSII
jgi:hypothetical protein